MAEYWFGKADGCRSAFGFLINRAGVGGALLVDGEVFRGFRGGAGEVGHTIVDIHGAKCSCGNYGCLETLVNEQRLIREVSTGLKMGQKSTLSVVEDYDAITLKQIMQAAGEGIPSAGTLWTTWRIIWWSGSQHCHPLLPGNDRTVGRDDLEICLLCQNRGGEGKAAAA